jgi:hypothetical protein
MITSRLRSFMPRSDMAVDYVLQPICLCSLRSRRVSLDRSIVVTQALSKTYTTAKKKNKKKIKRQKGRSISRAIILSYKGLLEGYSYWQNKWEKGRKDCEGGTTEESFDSILAISLFSVQQQKKVRETQKTHAPSGQGKEGRWIFVHTSFVLLFAYAIFYTPLLLNS